jgi:3-oxoacyl-[acyl-carrier protein] reductase
MGTTIIVGGTKGIGKSIAKYFHTQKKSTITISRSKINSTLAHYSIDLNALKTIKHNIQRVIDEHGLVENLIFAQKYRGTPGEHESTFNISLKATEIIIEELKFNFCKDRFPSIVVLGSPAGKFIVGEQQLSYHTSKAALEQLVRYYAVNLGIQGIRVNCLMPGTVIKDENSEYYNSNNNLRNLLEDITPLRRLGTAEDIADVVGFLCSSQASFITGQSLFIDGGLSLVGQESLARRLKQMEHPNTISV